MSTTDKGTSSSGDMPEKTMQRKRSEKVSDQSGEKEPRDSNNNRESPRNTTQEDAETTRSVSHEQQDQRPVRNYRVRKTDNGGYAGGNDGQYRDGQPRDGQFRERREVRDRQPRDNYDRSSGFRPDYKTRRDRNDRNDQNDRSDKPERSERRDRSDKQSNTQHTHVHVQADAENDSEHNPQEQPQDVVPLGTNTREFIELPESLNDFEDMKFLTENIFRGINEYGFKSPSLIQAKTIHIINSGCDLIAQSQSGSGKTGAFAIGSLSRVDPKACYPQVLMIANTRLLALQIHKVVENIAKFMGIEVVACVGGHKSNSQMNAQQIKYAHVLVGTPGRVCEMLTKRAFDGKKVKTLIMDESDVLLKDDFRPQIIEIIAKLSEKTQICIFSATFTKETLQLTEKFLRDPYRVTVEKEEVSVRSIKQYKVDVGYERNKFATLKDLFTKLTFNQMIIFVRSIKSAEELRNRLMDQNIQAGLVHGKMNSIDRENVLKEFRLAYIKILISTDVMCRGIDIDDLRIVINYDMPEDEETYIHRVGRSGRYGGQGVAVNFCTFDDGHKIRILTREYNLDIQDMPDPEEVNMSLIGMAPPVGKVSSAKNYSY